MVKVVGVVVGFVGFRKLAVMARKALHRGARVTLCVTTGAIDAGMTSGQWELSQSMIE